LTLDGHDVVAADCAAQAMQSARNAELDVAVIDHFLPTTDDALRVARAIVRASSGTAILLISAFSSTAAGIEMGKIPTVEGFFEKDFRLVDNLRAKIREVQCREADARERETDIRKMWRSVKRCRSSQAKGRSLEKLIAKMVEGVHGFEVSGSNVRTATEEIDILVRVTPEAGWPGDVNYLLFEAKNWSSSVGKNEYVQTWSKLLNRHQRVTVAFLITTGKITRPARLEATRHASEPYIVVLVDGEGLRTLVQSENRSVLFRQLHEQAFLT